MRGYCKRQANIHPTAVSLHGRVEELFDFSERHDFVEPPVDLPSAHPDNAAVEVDVLAPRQLRMKAGADLQQATNAAVELHSPSRRLGNPAQDLQQRAL